MEELTSPDWQPVQHPTPHDDSGDRVALMTHLLHDQLMTQAAPQWLAYPPDQHARGHNRPQSPPEHRGGR